MATLITQDELLEALAQANAAPSEARTAQEIADATGWTIWRVRTAIGKLAKQQRVELHHVMRTAIDGRTTRIPAYTIKPAKRAK